jgi:ribosomal protein S18 acetylase RimI-like enzyme
MTRGLAMLTNLQLQIFDDEAVVENTVRQLDEADFAEVIAYLATDPVRNVHLHGLVVDNGLENVANRGTFYGYFNDNELSGVALLGHNILMSGDEKARAKFADLAVAIGAKGHLVFGPRDEVTETGDRMIQGGRKTKVVRDSHWCVCEKPLLPLKSLQMRRAGPNEIDAVATAQAEMVTEECGVDPRVADPIGFRERVAKRVNRGRIWCMMQDDKVIFKTDLISVSPEAVYVEGLWTHPDHRGQGVAKSCLNELAYRLLRQYKYVCLFVDPGDPVAEHLYEAVGFVPTMDYRSHYMEPLTETV